MHLITMKQIVFIKHKYLICYSWSCCISTSPKELSRNEINKFHRKLTTQLHFQQSSSPEDTAQTTNGIDMRVPDLDFSTELHITRLDEHKPPFTVTYRVENNLLKHVHDILSCSQRHEQSRADDEECRNSWMMVAMVIDRILLLVFTLLTIVVSSVLLLNHPTYGYKHENQPLDTLELSWMSHWHRVTCCDMMCWHIFNFNFDISSFNHLCSICMFIYIKAWNIAFDMIWLHILLTWSPFNIGIIDNTVSSVNNVSLNSLHHYLLLSWKITVHYKYG